MQARFLLLRRPPFYLSRTVPIFRSYRMSTAADPASKPGNDPTNTSATTSEALQKSPLALPEAPHNATELDMSGGITTFKFDHLGPIVVNVNGTMSRISNWDNMADIEKKNTLRIISKRNQERLAVLKAKEGSDTTS